MCRAKRSRHSGEERSPEWRALQATSPKRGTGRAGGQRDANGTRLSQQQGLDLRDLQGTSCAATERTQLLPLLSHSSRRSEENTLSSPDWAAQATAVLRHTAAEPGRSLPASASATGWAGAPRQVYGARRRARLPDKVICRAGGEPALAAAGAATPRTEAQNRHASSCMCWTQSWPNTRGQSCADDLVQTRSWPR